MGALAKLAPSLPPMSDQAVRVVSKLAELSLLRPQVPLKTSHLFHAGVYSRTIVIPAGTMLTGVLIKIPTVVIVSGDAKVFVGDKTVHLTGCQVLPASSNRKQAYFSLAETSITMIFATTAKTVEEAEMEFTDEFESLMSHGLENDVIITGE